MAVLGDETNSTRTADRMRDVSYGEWFFCIAPRYGRTNSSDATASRASDTNDAQTTNEEEENDAQKDQAKGYNPYSSAPSIAEKACALSERQRGSKAAYGQTSTHAKETEIGANTRNIWRPDCNPDNPGRRNRRFVRSQKPNFDRRRVRRARKAGRS